MKAFSLALCFYLAGSCVLSLIVAWSIWGKWRSK